MALILGIESSCDETAAAVVEDGRRVVSNVVASQIAKHSPYGGVIPELAAREHLTAIGPVVDQALKDAGITPADLSAVAVTHAPGLVPALLIGMTYAKGFAIANNLPLIGINHFLGHIYGAFVGEDAPYRFDDPALYPMLAAVVSGGHTSLVVLTPDGKSHLVGTTLDDAAGEAFDKAAKLLDLGYPGGPIIERLAKNGKTDAHHFPRSLTGAAGKPVAPENRFNFSFSGLKTSLLYLVRDMGGADKLSEEQLYDCLASYQEAIVDVLCTKIFDAAKQYRVKSVVLCGGVSCNGALRERFEQRVPKNLIALTAPKKYCTDNAAMIGGLASFYHRSGAYNGLDLDAQARLPLSTELPFSLR